MCGIYGIISPNFLNRSNHVREMMRISEHRGPDSQNIFETDSFCLGFNRLKIVDLDNRSNQPFFIEEINKSIVFNGEIYNYLELKEELIDLGCKFNTTSDTEVALMAYHVYGLQAFEKFNGMWAMCIIDHISNEALFSRDRFGVKPLYYMYQNEGIYFASELKSLIAVKNHVQIDEDCKWQYLKLGVNKFPGYKTIYHDIFEHPSGQYSLLKKNKLHFKTYYSPPVYKRTNDFNNLLVKLEEDFLDAVRIRLRSDVEIALLLSGGIDSTSIALAINKLIERKEVSQTSVTAFTLDFNGFKDNEWEIVQGFSKYIPNINIEPIRIDLQQCKNELISLIRKSDNISLSVSHLFHIIALREIKKKGFTVVLNGQGSDEVYGGYFPTDLGYLILDILRKQGWRSCMHEIREVYKNYRYNLIKIVKMVAIAIISTNWNLRKLIKSRNFRVFFKTKRIQTIGSLQGNYLKRSVYQVFETEFNGILNYEDSASMLNSIEIRSPFMDYRIINIGLQLGEQFKLKNGFSKWILRMSIAKELPDNIRWSTHKLGYVVPKTYLLDELLENISSKNESEINNLWRKYNLNILSKQFAKD